jgi:hypothetical protein
LQIFPSTVAARMVPTSGCCTHEITPGGPSDSTHCSRSRHLPSAPEFFRRLDRVSPHHPSTRGSAWGEWLPRWIGHWVRVRLDRRIGRASDSGDCSFGRIAGRFGSCRFWVCRYAPGNTGVEDDRSEWGRFDISELGLNPRQFFGRGRIRQRSGSGWAGRSEQ